MFYMLSLHTFYSASQRAVRDTAVQRRIMEHADSQNIAQFFYVIWIRQQLELNYHKNDCFGVVFLENTASDHRYSETTFLSRKRVQIKKNWENNEKSLF